MNDSDALEVSMTVWFDDDVQAWVYAIMSSHGEEETLIAWGETDSRDEASKDAMRELDNYLSGV